MEQSNKSDFFESRKPIPRWIIILLGLLLFPVLLSSKSVIQESERQRYIRKKYKKVVKKGILWDTVYWIERD